MSVSLVLEPLEDRCLPSLSPLVSIVGVGVDANAFVPMVNVMIGDNTSLLQQAGYSNIGHGSLAGVVNLPSNGGTLTESQLDAQISNLIAAGQIPAGPNAMVLVFLDHAPANPVPNAAAWHDGFLYNGQEIVTTWTWTQAWESIPAFHEFDEAIARMAGVGYEICDPVENQGVWNAEPLDGFNISDFVKPDGVTPAFPLGQPYIGDPHHLGPFLPPAPPAPPVPPVSPASLLTLGIEKIEADLFGLLARVNPAFKAQADLYAQQVATNPLHGTSAGAHIEQQADLLFASWLTSQ